MPGYFAEVKVPLDIPWNEIGIIASILTALATVAAVFAAVGTSRNAAKQLASALAMQEQTKNVMLFERREAILHSVSSPFSADVGPNQPIDISIISILFDDVSVCSYRKMLENLLCARQNCSLADEFLANFKNENRGPSNTIVHGRLAGYRESFMSDQCTDKMLSEFEKDGSNYTLASKHFTKRGGGNVNLYEISVAEKNAIEATEAAREIVLRNMQDFISNSIEPVEKPKRKNWLTSRLSKIDAKPSR